MISDEEKERVRQGVDFQALVSETVELKRRGSDYWGCCPFHHEKSPSFKINPSTGLWKCFGCGAGGDVFTYVMKRENLEFVDSIRYLADKAGIELQEEKGSYSAGPKKKRITQALEEAQGFYATMLMRGRGEGPSEARKYLAGRGFNSQVCRKWNLGFAPGYGKLVDYLHSKGFTNQEIEKADLAVFSRGALRDRFYNRVMFPIHDEQGRCIGFGGRVLNDAKPKYLNTKETQVFHKSRHMFAFDMAKEGIVARNMAIVVEGYTDVISLHEAGFTNVVATLGTALSQDHVKTLSRFAKTIVFMFDGDAAGQTAAERAIKYIETTQSDLRCVVLPDNLDPAEFIAARGAEALQSEIDKSRPLIDFVFEIRLGKYDLSVPGQRVAAYKNMCQLLSVFKHSILLDSYAMRLADALGLDVQETKKAIQAAEFPETKQVMQDKSYQTKSQRTPGSSSGFAGRRASAPTGGAQQSSVSGLRQGGAQGRGAAPGQGSMQASGAASRQVSSARGYEDSYAAGGYDDEAVPDSVYDAYAYDEPDIDDRGFVPDTTYGQTYLSSPSQPSASAMQVLSADDRAQAKAEKELLALLAERLDAMRAYETQILDIWWVNPVHKDIAQSMFNTAVGTPAAQMVAKVIHEVPGSEQILASGKIGGVMGMSFNDKVQFLLTNIELYTTKRRIRSIRSSLGGDSVGDEQTQLLSEATQLQLHVSKLSQILADMANGHNNG